MLDRYSKTEIVSFYVTDNYVNKHLHGIEKWW